MIPVFLKDTFYLIDNMGLEEMLEIANTEGLNSPKIRAKAVMQLNVDFFNSSMIKGFLPNIKIGVFEVSDKYLVKTIGDISDLDYFLSPDNKRYTCDIAYYSSNRETNIMTETPLEILPVSPSDIIQQEQKQESGAELPPAQHPKIIEDEAKTAKLEAASFLDGFLSKYHRISTFIPDFQLEDIERYLNEIKNDLDREVKNPFLASAGITEIIDCDLGTGTIKNAVGSSNNMLDALLVFPVFSALVGKKDLSEKFSMLALEDSEFVRMCPVGVDEKGNLFGFVHVVKLTSPIINKIEGEIKNELKRQGRKFARLSSFEKYQMFEVRFAEYCSKKYGKMLMASDSRKYVNIAEFINNMSSNKYVVPAVYSEEEEMVLWPSHENITFDNRGTKTLKAQVERLYSMTSVESTSTIPLEPSQNELVSDNSPNPLGINLALFSSLVNVSGREVNALKLYNPDGYVVDEILFVASLPTKDVASVTLGDSASNVVTESVTIGGTDPLNPTKYVDADGRAWTSEDAYRRVMDEIFGGTLVPRK